MRGAQRDADYAYRLAVDPPASKELRLFGLAGWTIDRFVARRTRLHELQYEATRLRERPVLWSMLLVIGANVVVFWSLASAAAERPPHARRGRRVRPERRRHVDDRVRRAQLGARRSRGAGGRRAAPRAGDGAGRRAAVGPRSAAGAARARDPLPRSHLRLSRAARPVLDGFDLTIPAGSSLAIVGQNGAGKTTLAKLLCRLYDPQSGAIEVDGVDLRELDLASWRSRVAAVFQDFIRFELPLRDNVAPAGAPDDVVLAALESAGAANLAGLDTVLARGYEGGTDLSGGQWQRVALARALVRRAARRRRRAARRAHRAARRARRGRDLRAHPRRPRGTARRS